MFEDELEFVADELNEFGADDATGTAKNPDAVGSAEKPNDSYNNSEINEEHLTGAGNEQNVQERARFADENRKRTIEVLRQEKAQLEQEANLSSQLIATLKTMGVPGETPQEIMQSIIEANLKREGEDKGYNPEEYSRLKQAEFREQQLLNAINGQAKNAEIASKQERVVSFMQYAEKLDPTFFEQMSEADVRQIAMIAKDGIMPNSRLFSAFARPATKTKSSGTDHLLQVGVSGSNSGAIDVPASVIADYVSMGFSKEDAEKDYIKQMKGKLK